MKRWLDPTPHTAADQIHAIVGGHPLIAQQLAQRGITSPDDVRAFIDPAAYTPAPPSDLPDMAVAVERLQRAIKNGEKIMVWGDFDVDGQTSTSVLVSGLRGLGATVDYHIPGRFSEGHGIRVDVLADVLKTSGASVLLTCDTGVAAHEAATYTRSVGVDMIVTDHHSLPETLPDAVAVVNPMRLPDGHPLRDLAGVGVAYKLMEALYNGRDTTHLLDLVALGLIADVMVQRADTRYLIQRGLAVMRQGQRAGIREILQNARINPADVNEGHVGFTIAPRLNALGRLRDTEVNRAVDLLTGDNVAALANELESLNAQRRFETSRIYDAAQDEIRRDPSLLEYAALVIARPDWNTGVVGIVANRLAEDYERPVLLLSITDDSAAGSARSIDGCNITDAISAHADLLTGFGGHVMAAGLRLPAENIGLFRRELSRTVRAQLAEREIREPTLDIDAYLPLADLSLELAEDIERLAPFGNGNPPLTLATRDVTVTSKRTLGRGSENVQLTVQDRNGDKQRVIWWRATLDDVPEGRFDIAYTLRVDTYRDERRAVIEWLDYRPIVADAVDITPPEPTITVIDYRGDAEPVNALQAILTEHPDALIWREAAAKDAHGVDRRDLSPADALIVWTTPPVWDVYRQAIAQVQPHTVYWFDQAPQVDTLPDFIARLSGVVKFVLNQRHGITGLDELAALMSHTEATVKQGLLWLQAKGQIVIQQVADEAVSLRAGDKQSHPDLPAIQRRLQALLDETAAYRRVWSRADYAPETENGS